MAKKKAAADGGRRAVALAHIELSDPGYKGRYRPGQIIEGEAASALIERYPVYFKAVYGEADQPNDGKEK